jgi:hypothetical protein
VSYFDSWRSAQTLPDSRPFEQPAPEAPLVQIQSSGR